jgi:hypothetical protein
MGSDESRSGPVTATARPPVFDFRPGSHQCAGPRGKYGGAARKHNRSAIASIEEKREVDKLKTQDQQVKAHERAHMAAGGGLIFGGANYTYQQGPDGKMSTFHLDRLYQHSRRAFAVKSEFSGGTGT